MGNTLSSNDQAETSKNVGRAQGVTEFKRSSKKRQLPPGSIATEPDEWPFIQKCLHDMLLFNHLDKAAQLSIVRDMYERHIPAGDILIQEGDTGMGASELYVVKSGEFEVLQRRRGVNIRVNSKRRGDTFGEMSLMYNCPRSATVAATKDSEVWVLEREVFRRHIMQETEQAISQLELFVNSVPILAPLSKKEKLALLDAFEEETFPPGDAIITQGENGDLFYIIKEGEAVVTQKTADGNDYRVNHLFKSDFFGEAALLNSAPRTATVVAITPLTCLTLDRSNFIRILGPLEELMAREKSPHVVSAKLMKLQSKGGPSRHQAMVNIKRRRFSKSRGKYVWELVRAVGHLDEVLEIKNSLDSSTHGRRPITDERPTLTIVEGVVLGGGAFSRVSVVHEEESGRSYALKRLRKTAVAQCPEHIYCEQTITRNLTHPFCIRQYGSFQDKYHLYFMFDLMTGGDLMDVLVADAHVVKVKQPRGAFHRGFMAPQTKALMGLAEGVARFYVASVILALEYLHNHNIVYRDLKPENVFIDAQGFPKLGDFGFAKVLDGPRTYTFCGTPGYVAPENILAHGYGYSVDWWGLGVLTFVLLTGRQPFTTPKTDDPMEVMRRIVDDAFEIKFPGYLSAEACDLVGKLLERKPGRRLGMLAGKATDVKNHPWFDGFDWAALAAKKMMPPRLPKDDAAKRIRDLANADRTGHHHPKENQEELEEANKIFEEF